MDGCLSFPTASLTSISAKVNRWKRWSPPSGSVTALEPVLDACDGTWIAHGSGDADTEVVDSNDRLRVPPRDPRYTLRRVWLTKEEEEGYYYGFANEGLWPLCHIAHARPTFRAKDWQHYQEVNRKFTAAIIEEIEDTSKPVILVQDYHFALLPRMIKEKRPDARVAIFWHIPWPNPEAFGICPWQRQLVDGLLGADLIDLHIQSHCNNFLQTVRIQLWNLAWTGNTFQWPVKIIEPSVSGPSPSVWISPMTLPSTATATRTTTSNAHRSCIVSELTRRSSELGWTGWIIRKGFPNGFRRLNIYWKTRYILRPFPHWRRSRLQWPFSSPL